MNRTSDFLIIGGGIIGLAIARSLKAEWPDSKILLLEKESSSTYHASGRNSGVLHAGFYYSPDSLKARLTRDGNQLLREFCNSRGLPIRETGKVVVTTDIDQLGSLEELFNRGIANGVQLEMVDKKELFRLEPLAATVKQALWSPKTAVADPKQITNEMALLATIEGVEILYGSCFMRYENGEVHTTQGTFTATHIVNCAGLYADRVARQFGHCSDYTMLPFTGLYAYAPKLAGTLKRHVYPVPDARNPFLGVHATVTVDNQFKIGPTAIPAFSREAYRAIRDLNLKDLVEIASTYPKFFTSPHHNVSRLIATEVPKYSRSWLVHEAKKLVPSLHRRDFVIKGTPGIRAQLFDLNKKKLEMDFVIRGDSESTHVLNAVSPAWTSSIPFAKYVVDDVRKRLAQ